MKDLIVGITLGWAIFMLLGHEIMQVLENIF